MLLAPTGVAAFNIQASTIHAALHLLIKYFTPLEDNALEKFQEELKHIRYILINEMSFIGPKLLSQIDEHLREAFPLKRNIPFSGCSIILVGDLGQLLPIKHIPLYAGISHESELWNTFNTIITLKKYFIKRVTTLLKLLSETPSKTLEVQIQKLTAIPSLSHEENLSCHKMKYILSIILCIYFQQILKHWIITRKC